jgi:hypothetical protein
MQDCLNNNCIFSQRILCVISLCHFNGHWSQKLEQVTSSTVCHGTELVCILSLLLNPEHFIEGQMIVLVKQKFCYSLGCVFFLQEDDF